MFDKYFKGTDVPLKPADLELLQRVLTSACAKRGAKLDSAEAKDLALLLINLFQSGVQSESMLLPMLTTAKL